MTDLAAFLPDPAVFPDPAPAVNPSRTTAAAEPDGRRNAVIVRPL